MLTTILDDAHLMDLANLRKLRLLFEDFPKNHNLVLIGRPNLLGALELARFHLMEAGDLAQQALAKTKRDLQHESYRLELMGMLARVVERKARRRK